MIDDTAGRAGSIWQFIDTGSVGGAERHIATLVEGLRRLGERCCVVLLADHGDNPWLPQLRAAGIRYSHLDGSFATLLRVLNTERPRLLHTHGYKAGILGRPAARLARVPVVSTFHSGERGAFPVSVYDAADEWTSFLGARIAVSAAIRDRLPFSAHLIPSYVTTLTAPSTAPLPRVAGFVGRLGHEKGPDIFCALAARAHTDPLFRNIAWHVWGDGAMRTSLEADYGTIVNFHGIATDMDAVWPRIGLLVMTSRSEGVPLAALEAAARGIPVLASRVGGLPTVVDEGRTGWLFDSGDVETALSALAAWQKIGADEAASLRRTCWERAGAEFSEARWLPEVVAVYRSAGCAMTANA